MSAIADADQRLAAALRASGHRVTSQRLIIHRELHRRQHHLTAEQVRAAVAENLPGTSTPTVYATLELLAQLGFVRRICAGTGAALYDARTAPHHHVVCRECGRVEDLEVEVDAAPVLGAARAAGFQPRDTQVLVSGRCATCGAEAKVA
jgi:Fe2+ or Zn2+ uptake regulation protein